MPDNENNHVVVAIFNNEHTARDATAGLKSWDKASDDIKLGAFGTIYKLDGEIKQDLGSDRGRGLLAGGVLGVIGAVLAGPLVLLAGLVGGIIKSFFTQSVGRASRTRPGSVDSLLPAKPEKPLPIARMIKRP